MRARFLSGVLYPTFRRARSVLPEGHGSSTRRFWMSTSKEKAAVTQTMHFAIKYGNPEDLVCPVKYFKEEVEFLSSLKGNELLKKVGRNGGSEVSMKVARAVRSLLSIIAGNHSIGIACGDSLTLSNLRISRSLGKFAMLEPPKPKHPDALHRLTGDFKRGADLLEELARSVLGPGVVMPRVWDDLIKKMREEQPDMELLMYHSLFLPVNVRYWLKVFKIP